MIGQNCGSKKAYKSTESITYGTEENSLIIEFSVVICPDCQESLISAETLEEIEAKKRQYDYQLECKKLELKRKQYRITLSRKKTTIYYSPSRLSYSGFLIDEATKGGYGSKWQLIYQLETGEMTEILLESNTTPLKHNEIDIQEWFNSLYQQSQDIIRIAQ